MDSHVELIKHVKLAINPGFDDYVLFSNGTYVIFEDADPEEDLIKRAIAYMKKYGPVMAGGEAGDFGTIKLSRTEGWVVSGHGYGMYTYVHPTDVGGEDATDIVVGLFGRGMRDQDSEELEVIYVKRAS